MIQDAFLRDIIEHRAEFIRAQCELAKLPENDPRRPGLERRSEELLGQHAGEWLKPLPEWAVRKPPKWRRGFVAAVWAKGEDFLRGAEELLRLCPLEGACLTEAREHLPELLQRTHLANLTSLELYGNGIGAEGAKALAGSPHLANLTSLDLGRNGIGDEGAVALASSPRLANLTSLLLGQNGISAEGAVALAGSPRLANLTSLDLDNNGIGDEGAVALASSPHLANLTTLYLHDNGIGAEGAKALASSPRLANLTWLDLEYNEIGDEGTEALRQRFGAGVSC